MIRRFLYGVLFVAIVIQFVRLDKNRSTENTTASFELEYEMPVNLVNVFKESCYDCHSNNTRYPWYSNIQPVGWWLQGHVDDAKRHLNFSEFLTYPEKKAKHKFEEIEEMIGEEEMPLESYLIIHQKR